MLAGHVRVRPMRAKQRITVACLAATGFIGCMLQRNPMDQKFHKKLKSGKTIQQQQRKNLEVTIRWLKKCHCSTDYKGKLKKCNYSTNRQVVCPI